jgi:hypothetical protein
MNKFFDLFFIYFLLTIVLISFLKGVSSKKNPPEAVNLQKASPALVSAQKVFPTKATKTIKLSNRQLLANDHDSSVFRLHPSKSIAANVSQFMAAFKQKGFLATTPTTTTTKTVPTVVTLIQNITVTSFGSWTTATFSTNAYVLIRTTKTCPTPFPTSTTSFFLTVLSVTNWPTPNFLSLLSPLSSTSATSRSSSRTPRVTPFYYRNRVISSTPFIVSKPLDFRCGNDAILAVSFHGSLIFAACILLSALLF